MPKETGAQAGRAEQEGAARLPHRGRLRGGPGAHRHRGEVAARRPRVAGRRLRHAQGRRGVAAERAHPRVHQGDLDQPRAAPRAQAAAAPRRDRQADRQDQGERPHARAARRCTSRTARPRSRSRSRGARRPTTSGRRWPSGRRSARPTGPWPGAGGASSSRRQPRQAGSAHPAYVRGMAQSGGMAHTGGGDRRRVLVTGATGYIGGRLVPELLDAGFDVRVLARQPGNAAGPPVGRRRRGRCAATPPSRRTWRRRWTAWTSRTTSSTPWAAGTRSRRRTARWRWSSRRRPARPASAASCTWAG